MTVHRALSEHLVQHGGDRGELGSEVLGDLGRRLVRVGVDVVEKGDAKSHLLPYTGSLPLYVLDRPPAPHRREPRVDKPMPPDPLPDAGVKGPLVTEGACELGLSRGMPAAPTPDRLALHKGTERPVLESKSSQHETTYGTGSQGVPTGTVTTPSTRTILLHVDLHPAPVRRTRVVRVRVRVVEAMAGDPRAALFLA